MDDFRERATQQALHNIRQAYHDLNDEVIRTLRLHVGDRPQIQRQTQAILGFLAAAEVHKQSFPQEEWTVLHQSIRDMLQGLDDARFRTADPPDAEDLIVSRRDRNGKRGRPRVSIHEPFLEAALSQRGPTALSKVFQCSARSVRRRALEAGFVQPGEAPFILEQNPDGSESRVQNPQSGRTRALTLSDEDLDRRVFEILQQFPSFGRRMLDGKLQADGFKITRKRLTNSYIRVHGIPRVFGDRAIHRRAYKVAGANSLWHHDGQHGLIKFKIVIHCFIDGHSRFVTGIRVSNNNRSQTVLDIFVDAISKHGTPSRVRGDHGTENLLVAQYMEDIRGTGRGSYIFGRSRELDPRSVHNTRIECLWYDVTSGFGQKWKNFFITLEAECGLNPQNPHHIWLLHHLFLPSIDLDAQVWAESWNSHRLQIRHQSHGRSPIDMFMFSMVEDGPRGIRHLIQEPVHEVVDNPAVYGIDWDEAADPVIMAHLLEREPDTWEEENPFAGNAAPSRVSHVPCEPPNCPFPLEVVEILDATLSARVNLASLDMEMRRLVWLEACNISGALYDQIGGGI